MAILSLLGLYKYNPTILDGLIENLPGPSGIPKEYPNSYFTDITIDVDALIGNLLLETAELEILYTDPDSLHDFIELWSRKQKRLWQSMYNTTCYKYNPIWNKDGTMTWTESETGNGINTVTEVGTNSNNVTEKEQTSAESTSTTINNTSGSGSGTNTSTEQVSAFSSNDFSDRQKTSTVSSTSNTEKFTGDGAITNNGTIEKTTTGDSKSNVSRETSDNNTVKRERTQKDQGNIGVTMTQDMIAKERESAMFNISDFIINDFKKRFCLLIY